MAQRANVLSSVSVADVRVILAVAPTGTSCCINTSLIIPQLILTDGAKKCKCGIFELQVPRFHPSFSNEKIASDPVLNLLMYKLRDFCSHVDVEERENCDLFVFQNVLHVDHTTLLLMLDYELDASMNLRSRTLAVKVKKEVVQPDLTQSIPRDGLFEIAKALIRKRKVKRLRQSGKKV